MSRPILRLGVGGALAGALLLTLCCGRQPSNAPTGSYTLTGVITPVASGSGATVTLSGTQDATTTADASGGYSFVGLGNGTYTVTPSKAAFTFTPTSRSVIVSGASQTGLDFTAASFSANLTVDGSRAFQLIDGMGANVNVDNWNGGQLRQALDLLVDQNGMSLARVVRDPMDWVSNESLIPALHNLDPTVLAQVYETPSMQDIWGTIGYLNQKGLRGSRVILNFMGWTPIWLGGSGEYGVASSITPGKEDEFATMVASLVYYGRRVKNLDFTLLAPLNEQDHDGLEGPSVEPSQYVTLLSALASELDAMGLTDVRLIGPDTAGGAGSYISAMMANPVVAGRVDHLAFHSYSGSPASPGAQYAGKNYWLTETSAWCSTCDENGAPSQGEWEFASATAELLLGDLANGLAAVLVWEGYDGFYFHHNSASSWGTLDFDGTSYLPRKRFYVYAQLNAFIRPGMRRVLVDHGIAGLETLLAFQEPTSHDLAVVGHVSSSSPVTIQGQLTNMPFPVNTMVSYWTTASANLQRGPDVPVAGGTFSVTVPGNSFFSLRSATGPVPFPARIAGRIRAESSGRSPRWRRYPNW